MESCLLLQVWSPWPLVDAFQEGACVNVNGIDLVKGIGGIVECIEESHLLGPLGVV